MGDVVQIDDGKMRHFQQLIQNVKFHSGEMKVLQGQSEKTAREANELARSRHATQLEAARAYDCDPQQTGRQNQHKGLQIQIPETGEAEDDALKEKSMRGGRQDSSRMDKSEGAQTSHSLQCGEENLLPSAEKKDAHSKISAQRIHPEVGRCRRSDVDQHAPPHIQH